MKGFLVALSAILMASCGGGGGAGGSFQSASTTISISISPISATFVGGTTQQFTATVTGTSNTAVTWQVNGVAGGNTKVGTITAGGLYTAPVTAPSPATVQVTAVSQADATKSATATVTVTVVGVSISPASVTLEAGQTQQFTATVTGTINTAVTWQVNAIGGGNATFGTISSTGLYTAPLSPPVTGAVSVSAVSQANPSQTALATVTITFSNASLNGTYSFLLSGDDVYGFFAGVGSFQADGKGNLLNGFEDLNYGLGPSFRNNLTLTGTYAVGPDGRGTMTISNSLGMAELSLIVISNERARFVEYNTSSNGEGQILKRDPGAFSTAAITGAYAFGFGGSDINGGPASLAGRFVADGAGNLTAGAEDANEEGVITPNAPLTGTYSVSSNGRGTATIAAASGTTHFVFHVVTQDTLFFVESDYPFPVVDGTAKRQQAGKFSNPSLTGDYAFSISGLTTLGYVATAGRFTSDGSGNLSNGVFDKNDTGKVSANTAFTGSSSVSSIGRGTATLMSSLGSSPLAFYMVSSQEAFVISTDPNTVESGSMLAQVGGPFDNASTSGSFGFRLFTSNTDIDQVGQATLDGVGTISGFEDINAFRVLTPSAMISGTYAMSANGRATATVTNPNGPASLSFYMVSDSRFFVVQDDASSVTSGIGEKQF